MASQNSDPLPWQVAAVGVALFVIGGLSVLVGLVELATVPTRGFISLCVGLAGLATGVLLFRRVAAAWWLALLFFGYMLLGGLIGFLAITAAIGRLIFAVMIILPAAMALFALLLASSRQVFFESRADRTPSI